MIVENVRQPRWFYPLVYGLLVIINLMPSYAQQPYAPQDSQDVILNLLMVSITPYQAFAPVFHVASLILFLLIIFIPARMGRLVAGYMGVNYIMIALAQTIGKTEKYGFVVHTGALVTSLILGLTWLVVAWRNQLQPRLRRLTSLEVGIFLFGLLAFWAPYSASNGIIRPLFDPRLLLTSPDYGLTFCFTTPVFLLGLILFYPNLNQFAYRITAFSGLLFALVNMTHWFDPNRRWMGFLHLPLLVTSIYALLLPRSTDTHRQQNRSPNLVETARK